MTNLKFKTDRALATFFAVLIVALGSVLIQVGRDKSEVPPPAPQLFKTSDFSSVRFTERDGRLLIETRLPPDSTAAVILSVCLSRWKVDHDELVALRREARRRAK